MCWPRLALHSSHARGQSAASAVIQVIVTQDNGAPIAEANLLLRRAGGVDPLVGTTDAGGKHAFVIEVDTGRYTLVVRKVGYVGATRNVPTLVTGQTIAMTIVLVHLPMTLDTVRSLADIKKYRLDAADIAASSRVIDNALDAIRKLNRDMLGDGGRQCPMVDNVWINGKRVFFVVRGPKGIGGGTVHISAPQIASALAGSNPLPVLASVKSEHIEQMTYVNCWDRSMGSHMGADDALHITLKPGIAWNWKFGSYVADSVAAGLVTKPGVVRRDSL